MQQKCRGLFLRMGHQLEVCQPRVLSVFFSLDLNPSNIFYIHPFYKLHNLLHSYIHAFDRIEIYNYFVYCFQAVFNFQFSILDIENVINLLFLKVYFRK